MESKLIHLTDGRAMIVDTEDYDWAQQHRWYPVDDGRNCYAATEIQGKRVYAHRPLAGAIDTYDFRHCTWRALDIVDHINGDGLDNRKANLRVVTPAQNACNSAGKTRTRKSRFKGVSYCRNRTKPWRATIELNGVQQHLGYFACEAAASQAYDKAAIELFGEFAYLNSDDDARLHTKRASMNAVTTTCSCASVVTKDQTSWS